MWTHSEKKGQTNSAAEMLKAQEQPLQNVVLQWLDLEELNTNANHTI